MRIKWNEIEMKNWNKIETWEHRNEEKKEAKNYNYENIIKIEIGISGWTWMTKEW